MTGLEPKAPPVTPELKCTDQAALEAAALLLSASMLIGPYWLTSRCGTIQIREGLEWRYADDVKNGGNLAPRFLLPYGSTSRSLHVLARAIERGSKGGAK